MSSYTNQPSNYSGRSVSTQGRIMPVRRSSPPRFRPWIIIIVVMSLGLVFIGLTLTIIAHWPGYTAIGGNPLEIVGPVLLSVGAVIFIITIVVVVMRNQQEKASWQQNMAQRQHSMYNSRTSMYSANNYSRQMHNTTNNTNPSVEVKPTKSILKTPSTSTYGGRNSDIDISDSGVAHTSNNLSYEPDSGSEGSGAGRNHRVYRIETMPDPNQAREQRKARDRATRQQQQPTQDNSVPYEQSSTDSETHVPVPIRTRSRDRKRNQGGSRSPSSYSNDGFSGPEADTSLTGTPDLSGGMVSGTPSGRDKNASSRQMADHSSGSYDMYADQRAPRHQPEQTPTSAGQRSGQGRSSGRSRRKKQQQQEQQAPQHSAPPSGVHNNAYQHETPEKSHQDQRSRRHRQQQPQPSPQMSQDPVRINIHTQPGANVQITPGQHQYAQQYPPQQQYNYYDNTPGQQQHQPSSETEI